MLPRVSTTAAAETASTFDNTANSRLFFSETEPSVVSSALEPEPVKLPLRRSSAFLDELERQKSIADAVLYAEIHDQAESLRVYIKAGEFCREKCIDIHHTMRSRINAAVAEMVKAEEAIMTQRGVNGYLDFVETAYGMCSIPITHLFFV